MNESVKIQSCVQCKATSPVADAHALISAKFGWRLIRRFDSHRNAIFEWRCPSCADRYKRLRTRAGQSSGFLYAVIPGSRPPQRDAESSAPPSREPNTGRLPTGRDVGVQKKDPSET